MRRSHLWSRMVNEAREGRTLGPWRRVAIARPNLMWEEWGRLTSSCCFARCTKSIARGSGGAMTKVGIAVSSEWNVCIYHLCKLPYTEVVFNF